MIRVRFKEEEVEQLADAIAEGLALELVDKLKENIREMNLIAWGRMINSIRIVKKDIAKYEIDIDVPYASWVEYGTRPHKVPKRALYEWAKVKFKVSDNEAWAIATSVAKKIEEEGTKPHPFARKSMYELINEVERKGLNEVVKIRG